MALLFLGLGLNYLIGSSVIPQFWIYFLRIDIYVQALPFLSCQWRQKSHTIVPDVIVVPLFLIGQVYRDIEDAVGHLGDKKPRVWREQSVSAANGLIVLSGLVISSMGLISTALTYPYTGWTSNPLTQIESDRILESHWSVTWLPLYIYLTNTIIVSESILKAKAISWYWYIEILPGKLSFMFLARIK